MASALPLTRGRGIPLVVEFRPGQPSYANSPGAKRWVV